MKNQQPKKYDPRSDPVVLLFGSEVRRRLGGSLRQLCLFGSRARGDARDDSDYDMLVVVDRRTPEIRGIVVDIEVDILDRYQVLVASIVRGEEEWRSGQGFPLARNIAREGVPI